MPDIDLDFPRDIREKLIVARLRALRPRALGARRELLDLPRARRDPRRRQGARPAVRRARAARAPDRRQPVPRRRGAGEAAGRRRRSARRRAGARSPQLCGEIGGLPRHISQHPGGMVISTRPLVELVPVQPAAMEGRQLCQWDKDSCADAGFLKIDLLGLGMLSAVEDCVEQIARRARRDGRPLAHPARRPGGLRRDPGGGHGRRLPDREPRADAVAAADAAGEPRRPDDPGRARAAGPDPGRRRPPVHRQPPAAARGPGVRAADRPPAAGGAAARDARGDRLPGPGARGRDGAGRLLDRRGRGAAPGDEPEALARGDRGVPRPLRRGRRRRRA